MSSNHYEAMVAKKVNLSQWKNHIAGPEMRFHSIFEFDLPEKNWKLVNTDISRSPAEFILRFVDKQYVSRADTNQRVLVQYALCESVRSAHEVLFTSLLKITNPAFPIQYPNQIGIGDVYIGGYWARDNLFVSISDLSSQPMPEKNIQELDAMFDAKLLEIPTVNADDAQKDPSINKFTLQSKIIPIGESAQINLAVNDQSCSNDKLNLLLLATGGKVSLKADIYFYTAETIGQHTLDLFVTNPSGKTSKASLDIKIVE